MSTATAEKPSSKTAWASAKRHVITLPSSTKVAIELPNLGELMKAGELPNDLIEAATAKLTNQEVDGELVKQLTELNRHIVALTVKEPEIKLEDVPTLPSEDLDMIVQFANRERDVDAVGHHIGGLETTAEWRRFRYGSDSDASLLGG